MRNQCIETTVPDGYTSIHHSPQRTREGRAPSVNPGITSIGRRPEHREWTNNADKPWYPALVHEDAIVNSFVTIDGGCYGPTKVGRSLVMAHVHVGHDCSVGDGCEIAPHAVLCGHVELGDNVKVGVGALILPGRTIGAGARIGSGAVITKHVGPGEVWFGNPARKQGEAADDRVWVDADYSFGDTPRPDSRPNPMPDEAPESVVARPLPPSFGRR